MEEVQNGIDTAVDALIGMSGMPVPDLAVVVLDATALSRSLYLLSMVVELGLPTVVALTMNDLAVRNGCGVDAERRVPGTVNFQLRTGSQL